MFKLTFLYAPLIRFSTVCCVIYIGECCSVCGQYKISEAMKLGCMVLFLMLIRIGSATHCTNKCSDKQEDWCGEKRMIDGQVKHCVERDRLVQ